MAVFCDFLIENSFKIFLKLTGRILYARLNFSLKISFPKKILGT